MLECPVRVYEVVIGLSQDLLGSSVRSCKDSEAVASSEDVKMQQSGLMKSGFPVSVLTSQMFKSQIL